MFEKLTNTSKNMELKNDNIADLLETSNLEKYGTLSPQLISKIKDHKELCDYIHNLYVTKNRDYGDSMHPLYKEYGLTAFLIMFSIKINRIRSLMEKGSATYESLEDSLLDLANYAIISVVELHTDKNTIVENNKDIEQLLNEYKENNAESNE